MPCYLLTNCVHPDRAPGGKTAAHMVHVRISYNYIGHTKNWLESRKYGLHRHILYTTYRERGWKWSASFMSGLGVAIRAASVWQPRTYAAVWDEVSL